MYNYTERDQTIINERVQQYRGQTERFLNGELTDNEFLPLRLQNGLYIQRFAPLLRIAIPYGTLSSVQLRKLAQISRTYDKGYGHISTRQNMQLNWPPVDQVPDILEELASVQMSAIQTSGGCIRVTTTDQFAGATADEVEDPRPWCEIIRQWSTLHPEFAFLPRKFKIAVCASEVDRAAMRFHDIGVQVIHTPEGETAFNVYVGGGLGRTPVISQLIGENLPKQHLISYLDAVLRVYNQHGRRDNKYKARVKILVRAMGVEAFREAVDKEWQALKDGPRTLPAAEIKRIVSQFQAPAYEQVTDNREQLAQDNPGFAHWLKTNVAAHKQAGYAIVTLSLKQTGSAPGDISSEGMEAVADLADQYSFGELRTSHRQNLIFPYVRADQLLELWQQLKELQMATANINMITDTICCPGGDYCALANAKSLPISEQVQRRFDALNQVNEIGELELNISGCMNACGHHHVGGIGILGVDKKGKEYYQVSLGGNSGLEDASIGKILGPSFEADEVADVIETLIKVYLEKRESPEERFVDTYQRIGIAPFKERVYA